jgi:hypothetical protein
MRCFPLPRLEGDQRLDLVAEALEQNGHDQAGIRANVDEPGAKALQALVERDIENAWLSAQMCGSGPLDDLLGHSITYRIAAGPWAGQKLFTLQHAPADSRCTPASISSPASVRSWNGCAAM